MGNVKRCRQVYVCISTAVKNRSVILYFCCSKLLDLFIYFLAHLTTTTHLSVSLAPMQNATKACAAQLIHFGILFVIFFICSVVSLASASLLFLFFLWLSFLCQTNQHRFFRAVVQEHLLQSTYCFQKIQSALISRPFGTIQKVPRKWSAVFSQQTGSGFKGAFIIYCVYGQLETRWASSHSCDTSLQSSVWGALIVSTKTSQRHRSLYRLSHSLMMKFQSL